MAMGAWYVGVAKRIIASGCMGAVYVRSLPSWDAVVGRGARYLHRYYILWVRYPKGHGTSTWKAIDSEMRKANHQRWYSDDNNR